MEEKKKSNSGLIILVVILLLACAGMGAFIFANKDKLTSKENPTTLETEKKEKNNNTEKENDMFKDETIHSYYYETQQEGTVKYYMSLISSSKNSSFGYFNIRYVSMYDSGSESSMATGYYDIKDGKLKFSVGPITDSNKEESSENIFSALSANLEVDPEQDWRNAPTAPSYYKMYKTTYNENELTIGSKTFYKVK